MKYIAFIHKKDGGYVAVVPNLNFTSSYGNTLDELLKNKNIELEANATHQLIDIKVEKLKRINVMMRSDILEVLPERLVEFNSNRSAYLQALVLQDLQTHNIATL